MTEPLDVLEPILSRQKPDGTPVYSDEDIQGIMPVLLLITARANVLETLPLPLQGGIAKVFASMGLKPQSTGGEVEAALIRFLAQQKINRELYREVSEALGVSTAGKILSQAEEVSGFKTVGGAPVTTAPKLGEKKPEGAMDPATMARIAGAKVRI